MNQLLELAYREAITLLYHIMLQNIQGEDENGSPYIGLRSEPVPFNISHWNLTF